jgi:signal transduction histidine kinase
MVAADPIPPKTAQATPPAAPPPASRPVLLIVDDEAGPRESLRIVFKDRCQCLMASCGREGLEHARNHRVDVAILDIKMPDISGIEVLRELKESDPDIECIMLTGYETMETARAAIRCGAADYLNKPFDVFAMRDRLEQCLDRRRKKKELIEGFRQLKLTNEELARALAHRDRAVTAGVLSAGVVHEMNDPLTIIGWYTAMLDKDLAQLSSADAGAIQNIHQRQTTILREIERCRSIAQRFLSFSRQTRHGDETTEVAKLIEDAAALLKAHPANKAMEITFERGEAGMNIRAHPVEVLQILINLGVNAIQAMKGAGKLHLSAERASALPKQPAFRSETCDVQRRHAKLVVADTGPGIPPENLQKIFDPYFTTKPAGGGLGLAIVCKLVDGFGGLIDVQTDVGKGTTFSLYLPLAR